jgi:hypothetical protein
MNSETSESSKGKSDDEYRIRLAKEIKKKLEEKNWDEYERLIKMSRKIVYEVERNRLKKK